LLVTVTSGTDAGMTLTADSERICVGTADGNDLILADPTVSRYHAELIATDEGVTVLDRGSTNGTWLGQARVERIRVPVGSELRLGRSVLKVDDGEPGVAALHTEDSFGDLLGRAPVMRRLMARVARLGQSDVGVLIVGESGTGKELTARALHEQGTRASGPFVIVDCASLSPSLVASELFGHERGAFTGADRRHIGAFERAQGGTVLLDEVGELPLDLQANLLGVLERRRVRRVGGTEDLPLDVRLLSATHRDLRSDVNSGRFRLDLYYRLAVVSLELPPLRERREDVPLLVEGLLRECGYEGEVADLFPSEVMQRLRNHEWPGDVRELRNVVEATVATGESPLAPRSLRRPGPSVEPIDGASVALVASLDRPYKEARSQLLMGFETKYL
jgi:DNA-binding NtrC family response regulator